MVIDGTKKFSCHHEYLAMPFGFVCIHCEFERAELPIDGDKQLLFFPIPEEDVILPAVVNLP